MYSHSEYKVVVVEAEDLDDALLFLEDRVNTFLEDGWQVTGSLQILSNQRRQKRNPPGKGNVNSGWHHVDVFVFMQPIVRVTDTTAPQATQAGT